MLCESQYLFYTSGWSGHGIIENKYKKTEKE